MQACLLSIYYVPGFALSALFLPPLFNLTRVIAMWVTRTRLVLFLDEETETQGESVICPRGPSEESQPSTPVSSLPNTAPHISVT